MNYNPATQRTIRRCSQCLRRGCRKNNPTCIVNLNRDMDRMLEGLPPVYASNAHRIIIADDIDNDDDNDIVPTGSVKLGSAYIKEIAIVMDVAYTEEAGECGICYTNDTTIKTNCGHQYCRVCVQNQCMSIQHKTKGFDCAFCRSHVTQLNTFDESTHGILCHFIDHAFETA